MDPKNEELYFVAILPPASINEEVMEMKEYFQKQYQSKASLNSPGHITLHMPFKFKVKKEEKLIKIFSDFAVNYQPFTVQLKGFSAFPPRVIFIDVAPNEQLESLQRDVVKTCKRNLNLFNANYKEQGFHPHITLAFRDLKKPQFKTAWEEFKDKSYQAEFEVNSFYLLRHDGKKWQIFREFEFG